MSKTKQAELEELLLERFTADSLEVFLRTMDGGGPVCDRVAVGGVPFKVYAFQIVAELGRHGLVDRGFFEALHREFPRVTSEIARVASTWGFGPPESSREVPALIGPPRVDQTPAATSTATRLVHLTDLQFGRDDPEHRKAIELLPNFLGRLNDGRRIDVILVSGDVAWSGRTTEYDAFLAEFYRPLRADNSFSTALWSIVPGNHDVDCGVTYAPMWDHLGERRKIFFDDGPTGETVRGPRVRSFAAFEQMARAIACASPLPSQCVSRVDRLDTPQGRLGLLITNTAWFCDKDLPSSHQFPAPLPSLRAAVQAHADCDGFLVVGHHPLEAFRYEDRELLREFLADSRALYLHGHAPAFTMTHSTGQPRSIGLGTAASRAQRNRASAAYSHHFAIYTLEQDITLSLFRYEASTGWQEAPDLLTALRPDLPPERASRFTPPWRPVTRVPQRRRADVPLGRLESGVAGLSCLNVLEEADWIEVIRRYRLIDPLPNLVREESQEQNEIHFWSEGAGGRHRIVCMGGSGRVLSETQVIDANTQLDLNDYESFTIIAFGELADEARAAYVRLRAKKPLKILDRHDIADHVYARFGAKTCEFVESAISAHVEARIIMLSAEPYILLADKLSRHWIELYDDSCSLVADTHPAVVALREYRTVYGEAYYGRHRASREGSPVERKAEIQFDGVRYREALYEEFNSVRYAPLAAFGLRFSGATLNDLYVETAAQIEESHGSEAELARAIDEYLGGTVLDHKLRAQIRSQIRSALNLHLGGESDIARRLYQKHGSLLLLGTPGSGKTFFAKRELLAYCKPPAASAGWYSQHVPLFIPLAEAARAANERPGQPIDLLGLAARLPRRESTAIPERAIRELYAEGQLALFFDGLDEITSLAQRSAIADALGEILSIGRAHGNRIVITSRPSAVQVVNLASDLPAMTMCGLDEPQIRALAQRVLKLSVSDGKSGLQVTEERLQPGDVHLMERLLRDIEANVGLRRLATNPLLLTLLLMVYINSGAPSAKRHRVYQQAVQTLVTIRSRDTGQEVLPESDVRRRLGAVALSIFRNGRTAIPSLRSVIQVIQASLSKDQRRRVGEDEARLYLQQIADATGIVVLHPNPSDPELGSMTFMHYSFAEYYAAVGLDASEAKYPEVAVLARHHRWRETLTLYAGLLGDYGDLGAFISALLGAREPVDELTLEFLLFTFDCALESDVPPESVQEELLRECRKAMTGVLRYDRETRVNLSERLRRLYHASRSRLVAQFMATGLEARQPEVLAAYIDLFAGIFAQEDAPPDLMALFDRACETTEISVVRAICSTAEMGTFARNLIDRAPMTKLLEQAMEGTSAFKLAALRCLESASPLVDRFRGHVEQMMRDDHHAVSVAASRVFLRAYAAEILDDSVYRHLLLQALRTLARGGGASGGEWLPALSPRVLERLLASAEPQDRELGLYLLPRLKGEESFVHEKILEVLSGAADGSMLVAALSSLRAATSVRGLVRLGDLAHVRRLVEHKHDDVSLAAVRALADVGRRDPGTIGTLIESLEARRGEVFRESARVLTVCGNESQDVRDYLVEELTRRLTSARGPGAIIDLRQLLIVAASCDWSDHSHKGVCNQLWGLAENNRKDEALRIDCLHAFAAMVRIGPGAVERLLGLMTNSTSRRIRLGAVCAIESFLNRCRQKFDHINRIYPKLQVLSDELYRLGHVLVREHLTEPEIDALVRLGGALSYVNFMISAFGEFDAT